MRLSFAVALSALTLSAGLAFAQDDPLSGAADRFLHVRPPQSLPPYDFDGKNLTAYGGLLPVGTLLEKLGFRQLVEETLKVKRQTRVMPAYQFILARLSHFDGFALVKSLRFSEGNP